MNTPRSHDRAKQLVHGLSLYLPTTPDILHRAKQTSSHRKACAKECVCLLTDLVVVVGLKTTERPVVNHLTVLLPSTCAKAKHSGASKVKVSTCVPSVSHPLAAPSTHPIPSGDPSPHQHRSHPSVRCHMVPAPTPHCPDLEWPLSCVPKTMHRS